MKPPKNPEVIYVERSRLFPAEEEPGSEFENARNENGKLEATAKTMLLFGVRTALCGWIDKEGNAIFTVGHRRFAAMELAAEMWQEWEKEDKAGYDITRIDYVPFEAKNPHTYKIKDQIIDTWLTNMHRPMDMLEQCNWIKQMREHTATDDEILTLMGCSKQHMRDCLMLGGILPTTHEWIRKERISATVVIEIARQKCKEKDQPIDYEKLDVLVERACRTSGGKKVKESDVVKKPSLSYNKIDKLYTSLQDFKDSDEYKNNKKKMRVREDSFRLVEDLLAFGRQEKTAEQLGKHFFEPVE